MKNPIIADNKPAKINLVRGQEYHSCTCGKSKSQPLCDGAHVGTTFTPRVIVSDKDEVAYLCACKHTRNTLSVMELIHSFPMIRSARKAPASPLMKDLNRQPVQPLKSQPWR